METVSLEAFSFLAFKSFLSLGFYPGPLESEEGTLAQGVLCPQTRLNIHCFYKIIVYCLLCTASVLILVYVLWIYSADTQSLCDYISKCIFCICFHNTKSPICSSYLNKVRLFHCTRCLVVDVHKRWLGNYKNGNKLFFWEYFETYILGTSHFDKMINYNFNY